MNPAMSVAAETKRRRRRWSSFFLSRAWTCPGAESLSCSRRRRRQRGGSCGWSPSWAAAVWGRPPSHERSTGILPSPTHSTALLGLMRRDATPTRPFCTGFSKAFGRRRKMFPWKRKVLLSPISTPFCLPRGLYSSPFSSLGRDSSTLSISCIIIHYCIKAVSNGYI